MPAHSPSLRPLLALMTVASAVAIASAAGCTSDDDAKCESAECLGALDAALADSAKLDVTVDSNVRPDVDSQDAAQADATQNDASVDSAVDSSVDATADTSSDASDAAPDAAADAAPDANDGGPHAIATPAYPWRLAIGGGYAYVTSSGDVIRVPLAGGASTTIQQGNSIDWVAADANNVYFTALGTVYKRAHNGNANTPISNAFVASNPYALTVDATYVYWSEYVNGGAVRRVKIDGSLMGGEAVSPPLVYPKGIAFYNGGIYVGESNGTVIGAGRIVRLNPDGGAPFPFVSNRTGASMPTVDSTPRLYWYENGGTSGPIFSMPLPDGGAATQHAGTAIDPSFVTDGNVFYYGNQTGGIVKINVTNSTAQTLYSSAQTGGVYGLAVSGNSLYWTDLDGSRLMTANK